MKYALLLAVLVVSSCGHTQHCRTIATAEFGAAVGSIAFPVGTAIGAGVGALVGHNTTDQQAFIGENPWCQ